MDLIRELATREPRSGVLSIAPHILDGLHPARERLVERAIEQAVGARAGETALANEDADAHRRRGSRCDRALPTMTVEMHASTRRAPCGPGRR